MQQALAALKTRPKTNLPMPSKRSSVLNRSPERNNDDTGKLISRRQVIVFNTVKFSSESSTEDESIPEEIVTPDKEYNYPRDHVSNMIEAHIKPPVRESSIGIISAKGSQADRRKKHALPAVVSLLMP